jgi:hypothetical protein
LTSSTTFSTLTFDESSDLFKRSVDKFKSLVTKTESGLFKVSIFSFETEVDVEPAQIADALVDFYENKRADEFIENIKTEKLKYAWSQMTEAINNLIV